MKVEIEESKLQTAYANACDGVKDFMESLFGKKVFEAAKPTLDDYKTIRTYEDACEALGETPILSENRKKVLCAKFPDHYDFRQNMPNHIIALMKLETISRALWGRNFQPKPDGEGSKVYWYPWFALWTKKEVEDMNPEQRGALLSANAGMVRMRVSVVCIRLIVPRVRVRTLGSACAKKRKKRLSISGSNSLNFGLNI
jgi:hypothetical protein